MKKLLFSVAAIAMGTTAFAAAIEQVIVRQQWPWSTDVKVEYKLSGVTKPVDIAVKAYNGSTELSLPNEAITGQRYGIEEDGVGQLVIDPVKAFGTAKVALANFKVKLTVSDSPANLDEVIYKIFTLPTYYGSAMPCEDVTRKDILNGKYGSYETEYAKIGPDFATSLSDVLIWTGVTNDIAYKTTKLVMRKIPAAGKSFQLGKSGAGDMKADVTFTANYWMSVFETTCYQHRLLVKLTNSSYTYEPYENAGAARTAVVSGTITVSDLCAADYLYPGSGWGGNWPTRKHSEIAEWTPVWHLKKHSGLLFDGPTSAEWEFAARAGTTTALPSGKEYSAANFAEIGRGYGINCIQSDNPAQDCSLEYGVTIVGQYRPNAYGLYDMMGNAAELCLGYYNANEEPFGGTDPKGPTSTSVQNPNFGSGMLTRGGSYAKTSVYLPQFTFNDVGCIDMVPGNYAVRYSGYRICLHEADK